MAETVDLDEVVRPESPQTHYIKADALLRRAGNILEQLDETSWSSEDEGARNEVLLELSMVTALAQAHAMLSAGRAR